jgi:hypothetical protein
MTKQISFKFQGNGASSRNPFLQPNAHHGFRAHPAVEQKCVAKSSIDHLTTPGSDGPRLRMPIGYRR